MTLKVDCHASLGAVGREAWLRLEANCPGATVFQSWWWLSAWWPVWGSGHPLVVTVHEDGRLVGAAACFIDPGGRLGFIGEEHADYGDVLAEGNRPDVVQALVDGLFARRRSWRRLLLADVRTGTPLAIALAKAGAEPGAPVPCPKVRFAARGTQELLAKDSLRRHERKLAQVGALEFLHLDSATEITPWLPGFFAQHLERWSLTPTPSLFENQRNCEFYSELAASAEPGGSLLFTVVLAGGNAVAMHFGFRSQDELVWYKPTFDPRLAASGPGEVLLAELLRRAAREQCGGVDFTRGDEAFKLRFASEIRTVAAFEAWPDPLSRARDRVLRRARSTLVGVLDALGMKASVARLAAGSRRATGVLRREGPRAVVDRLREALARPRAACVEIFARTVVVAGGAPDARGPLRAGFCTSLDGLLALVDRTDPEHAELLRGCARRFAGGDELAVGLVAGELVAWGWLTRVSPLPVTEVEAWLSFGSGTVLCYDFRVATRARGQGYYRALLEALAGERGPGTQVIYARSDNAASLAGIRAAGFTHIGTLARASRAVTYRERAPGPVLAGLTDPAEAGDGG